MLRTVVLIVSAALIAVGGFLIFSAQRSDGAPTQPPVRTPAASIGPDGAEPAWTHVCLGTDDEPSWCQDI
ncbi:hypothetical protein OIU91_16950 [Streptomyces sp. NBC_01456]|uniref:hypothetical protein n=1 Tax=Streptomyces sp. NBC_01456 TaxID=2975868 RepID=UPI002E3747FF|nr:hypothetical protein [Streptomyces sp. NBC_01456]